jgi:ectoine hydroxylase-related dioxygenase (phytanoyl-CoA dioxygenase family)
MASRGWSVEYLDYLRRMFRTDPRTSVRRFPAWNLYAFAPGLTRRAHEPVLFRCTDVAAAVEAFRRDGFVILTDGLDPHETAKLYGIVKTKADHIVQRDADGLIPPETLHGPKRYSYGEYGHNPEWAYLGHNERVLPILRGIWEGHGFKAVAAGGDFVLPGGIRQALHNDLAWKGAGEAVPRLLIVNYYVADVTPASGPVRIVPRTARFPVPPHRVIDRFEPRWMRQTTVPGRAGFAVIRDPRCWHGGTANISDDPRYMPNVEYVVDDAPDDEIESTATLDQLERGEWIAEFSAA